MPNLTIESAHALIRDTINLGLRHAGYQRTVDLRADYLTILSGRGYERFLSRFIRREDESEYRQRLDLTYQNLSSTASPLVKKFGQISRIQDIKKGLNYSGTSERDQRDLQDVLDNFGGEGSAQRGSLDDYLSLHYDLISLYDPNAFLLLDFAPFNAAAGERARPYAVLFDCGNVLNFRYTRGDLDYLLVRILIAYKDPDGVAKVTTDLILFGGPFSIRYYHDVAGRLDLPETYEVYRAINEVDSYRMVQFSPGIQSVPAVRVGFMPDSETANLTCVSPAFHPALDQFRELVNLKSQNDLITRLHGFPRRYEFAPVCPGEIDVESGFAVGCNEGRNPLTNQKCRRCGGSGFLPHHSEQDVVRRAMPNDGDEIPNLSNLSFTEKPDLVTIQGFREQIREIQVGIFVSIFSTDQQVQVTGPAKTATEYTVSREDQNNTLLPVADHKSVIYKSLVNYCVQLMNISGEVETLYEYPRDLKLSSLSELYVDLKAARDAGAPDFEIEQILDDIARKRYESDPTALAHYFIKKQHVPYYAQTLDTFEYFDSTNRIPANLAILRANVDVVFGELEVENPTFYDLPYADRDALVSAKVETLKGQLPVSGVSIGTVSAMHP